MRQENIYVCKTSNRIGPSCYILEVKDQITNSVDLEEEAHYQPPHQDLHYSQIQPIGANCQEGSLGFAGRK